MSMDGVWTHFFPTSSPGILIHCMCPFFCAMTLPPFPRSFIQRHDPNHESIRFGVLPCGLVRLYRFCDVRRCATIAAEVAPWLPLWTRSPHSVAPGTRIRYRFLFSRAQNLRDNSEFGMLLRFDFNSFGLSALATGSVIPIRTCGAYDITY